ncbi:hypothetical protein F8M41_008168 [Gigaspora margarita]|uniref:Uncharacterized protein n=1 Tax=Gigaspora margarita TaxID=4874 RepID=A0A8H3X5F6_GIGMA|nr:hypothetical protein F8M41_008168 [Gigaspora margarita]
MDFDPCNRPSAKAISSKLSEWHTILENTSLSFKNSDIRRSFISANDEIKTAQVTLMKDQNLIYTSKLINTKEIKMAYESANFRDSTMYDLEVCDMQLD